MASSYPYMDTLARLNKSGGYTPGYQSGSGAGSSGGGFLSQAPDYSNVPSYEVPTFTSPKQISMGDVPKYQNPGELNMPTFLAPDLKEYIKNIEIPGVTIALPEIDKQFIREQTQELGSPALSEERLGFQEALQEARKYSDNPAVVSKVIRDLMRSRGTNISKILGASGQTATNMEAGRRAEKLNVDVNNANLEQTRNLTKVKAETEIANKEIEEQNARLYNEKMDAYQKVIQDMLNQRNAESTYNNNAAMTGWSMDKQNQIATNAAMWNLQNTALMNKSNMEYQSKQAGYEEDLKNGTATAKTQRW